MAMLCRGWIRYTLRTPKREHWRWFTLSLRHLYLHLWILKIKKKTGNANSLPIMFTKFPCDNVLELTEKLRDLMFQYVLTKQSWESVWKNQCQWKSSYPKPDSGIGINIWRNACVCIVLLNWFHNSQAEDLVPQIRGAVQREL